MREVRAAARGRSVVVIGESEPQRAELMRPIKEQGFGMDMLWNDDFHHAATVAVTGRHEAYFTDYRGTAPGVDIDRQSGDIFSRGNAINGKGSRVEAMRGGSLATDLSTTSRITTRFRMQVSAGGFTFWQDRGDTVPLPRSSCSVPGHLSSFRGRNSVRRRRSTTLPIITMHSRQLVVTGRKKFLAQFRSSATPEIQALIPDPGEPRTFERSKLNHADQRKSERVHQLYQRPSPLRQNDPVLKNGATCELEGAVLAEEALVLRFFGEKKNDRLLIVNLGRDLHLDPAPEPLLAPFDGKNWSILWSSEDPRYGGYGTPPVVVTETGWMIPGHAALCSWSWSRRRESWVSVIGGWRGQGKQTTRHCSIGSGW